MFYFSSAPAPRFIVSTAPMTLANLPEGLRWTWSPLASPSRQDQTRAALQALSELSETAVAMGGRTVLYGPPDHEMVSLLERCLRLERVPTVSTLTPFTCMDRLLAVKKREVPENDRFTGMFDSYKLFGECPNCALTSLSMLEDPQVALHFERRQRVIICPSPELLQLPQELGWGRVSAIRPKSSARRAERAANDLRVVLDRTKGRGIDFVCDASLPAAVRSAFVEQFGCFDMKEISSLEGEVGCIDLLLMIHPNVGFERGTFFQRHGLSIAIGRCERCELSVLETGHVDRMTVFLPS